MWNSRGDARANSDRGYRSPRDQHEAIHLDHVEGMRKAVEGIEERI